ncbi:myeloid leukemia factor 1 isoform 2-T2 [Discoglossus pictus]
MFSNLMKDLEDDPFFSDPFIAHQEHVRQMMRSFSEPFGRDPFFSITDGRSQGRRGQEVAQVPLGEGHRASSLSHMPLHSFSSLQAYNYRDTFHSMDNMMTNMRNKMIDLHKQCEDLSESPDAHIFKSSSVMTYSKSGNEPPKVFQATSQTRKAPGGIKETKRSIRDSESGIEKMAVGHHINDRGHIVKKSLNKKTGDQELNQEFLNLEEEEAQTFADEWTAKVSKFIPSKEKLKVEAPPKQKSVHHARIGKVNLGKRK